jgi:hypothetical protein
MKKLLLSLVFSFGAYAGFSQALTITAFDTTETGACSSDIECFNGDSIINNTAVALTIDVVRVMDVNTGTWQSAFCTNGTCYAPTKDSVRVTLTSNQHMSFIVHFYSDATPACGDVYFKFKNVNTPSNTIYQWYHACSQLGFGVHEQNENLANVSIYPMPVIAGNYFTMNISNVKTGKEISLHVFDIFGNEVYKAAVFSGINSMNLNLPEGIYSYSLISGDAKLGSGKIAVGQ